jgi:hypothetical protein
MNDIHKARQAAMFLKLTAFVFDGGVIDQIRRGCAR